MTVPVRNLPEPRCSPQSPAEPPGPAPPAGRSGPAAPVSAGGGPVLSAPSRSGPAGPEPSLVALDPAGPELGPAWRVQTAACVCLQDHPEQNLVEFWSIVEGPELCRPSPEHKPGSDPKPTPSRRVTDLQLGSGPDRSKSFRSLFGSDPTGPEPPVRNRLDPRPPSA